MISNWGMIKIYEGKRSWPNLKHYTDIYLEGPRETTKNFN
jgi:hypothetical protein